MTIWIKVFPGMLDTWTILKWHALPWELYMVRTVCVSSFSSLAVQMKHFGQRHSPKQSRRPNIVFAIYMLHVSTKSNIDKDSGHHWEGINAIGQVNVIISKSCFFQGLTTVQFISTMDWVGWNIFHVLKTIQWHWPEIFRHQVKLAIVIDVIHVIGLSEPSM